MSAPLTLRCGNCGGQHATVPCTRPLLEPHPARFDVNGTLRRLPDPLPPLSTEQP